MPTVPASGAAPARGSTPRFEVVLKRSDRYMTAPACAVGSALGRTASKVRRKDPRPLVIRPGGMGDLICAVMAVEELGIDPRSLLWVVERRSEPFAELTDLPRRSYDQGIGRLLVGLAGRHELVVNTEQRFGLAQAVARASTTPNGRLVSFVTNLGVRWSTDYVVNDWDSSHEVIEFRRLFAEAFEVTTTAERPRPRPRRSAPTGGLVVAISGAQSASRAYTASEWGRMIDHWAGGRPVSIVNAPSDAVLARAIVAGVDSTTTVVQGGFSAVAAAVASAERVFTIDGGMVHLASYFGVPATVVFTAGRDRKWAPLASGSEVVRRTDLPCQPCTVFGQTPKCHHSYACMRFPISWIPPALAVQETPTITPLVDERRRRTP